MCPVLYSWPLIKAKTRQGPLKYIHFLLYKVNIAQIKYYRKVFIGLHNLDIWEGEWRKNLGSSHIFSPLVLDFPSLFKGFRRRLMYQRILKLLENEESPLSSEAISEKTKESLMKTKSLLLRLQEEGKVESTKKDEIIVWQIKKKNDVEKKFEKMGR